MTMIGKESLGEEGKMTTRRQAIAGLGLTLGSLVASSHVLGEARQNIAEARRTGDDKTRTSLHQEVIFKASARRIYEALLDSRIFGAFSGEPAKISPVEGGAFSMFGGRIVGRNVELVPNKRIVQAWRPAHWNPGVFSIVKFDFSEQGSSETKVVLDQAGFPEGNFGDLSAGWEMHYWEPLKKYFARVMD
jgi:activator of HSP90 ATPase